MMMQLMLQHAVALAFVLMIPKQHAVTYCNLQKFLLAVSGLFEYVYP